jgi:CPA2 family monovalent cation:H+ antiporter-2
MVINWRSLITEFPLLVTLSTALIAAKALLNYSICRLTGQERATAAGAALHLAQAGEFGFVIMPLSVAAGVIGQITADWTVAVIAVSMVVTPLLSITARRLQDALTPQSPYALEGSHDDLQNMQGHVIVAGFGRVGRMVGQMLHACERPWLAIDRDPTVVAEARNEGLPVFFGDAARGSVLAAAGSNRAGAIILTSTDPTSAASLIKSLRRVVGGLPILVRARGHEDVAPLLAAGASEVIPELAEASVLLGSAVLRFTGATPEAIDRAIQHARSNLKSHLGTTCEREEN